jgi:hypothetical protein
MHLRKNMGENANLSDNYIGAIFSHISPYFYYPDSIEGHTYKNLRWNKFEEMGGCLEIGENSLSLSLMQECAN